MATLGRGATSNPRRADWGVPIDHQQHRIDLTGRLAPLLLLLILHACSKEARDIEPSVPQTAPRSAGDRRIAYFQGNVYQVSQGGRYFAWYGCGACHTEDARGSRNLSDGHWRHGAGFDRVYAATADGHRNLRYGERIPPEQLWQITAYVRDLPLHTPEKRRRLSVDQSSDAEGDHWQGPVR